MEHGSSGLRGGGVAVVGVADLVSPTGRLGMPVREIQDRVIRAALLDAGLALADVDGLFCVDGSLAVLELAEYLRISPAYVDSTMTGGSSFEVLVQHAVLALTAGLCDVALVVYGSAPRSAAVSGSAGTAAGVAAGLSPEVAEWELPYGAGIPVVGYALAARRHMEVYGTKPEALAEIAVATRRWAAMNPVARYRDPVTVDDVLSSPVVADPLRRLDCCLVTDGGGALVLTRGDRAASSRKPAYVLGTGFAMSHGMSIAQMPDLTVTPGVRSGKQAFSAAGVSPADIDVLEAYDSFTITVLLALEDLGFCAKGEAPEFIAGGRLAPGGALPANTSGGGLSYAHPGMFGIFLLVEAVRQVRGECGDRQVPDVRLALAHGCGGLLSATSTVILSGEPA